MRGDSEIARCAMHNGWFPRLSCGSRSCRLSRGLRLDGFSFDVEFLFAASKQGLPIREEVEFDVVERRPTRHAILLQSPRMLMDLLRIRLHGRAGRREMRV